MPRPVPDQIAFEEPKLIQKKIKFDMTPPASPSTPKQQQQCPKAPTKTPHRSPLKNVNGNNIHFLTQRKKTKSCSNHFEYLVKLGEGCFGQVWKVRSLMDDKLYAIKKSKNPIWETSERNQQLTEIEKGVKLGHHPNIVSISCAWEEGGHLYIQMELCERGNLKDALNLASQEEEGGRLPEYLIWRYIVDIAQGLKHIHSFGIVHLDIKPENLLFGENNALKICDFGISPEKDTEGDQVYMAPELLDDVATPEADIFSFGITIFEIATNYCLPNQGHWWRKLREGEIPFPEDVEISKDLRDLISQMMHPDRSKRISINQILDHPKVKETMNLIHQTRVPTLIRQSSIICNFTPMLNHSSNSQSNSQSSSQNSSQNPNPNNNNNNTFNIFQSFENEILKYKLKKSRENKENKENLLNISTEFIQPTQTPLASQEPNENINTSNILTPTTFNSVCSESKKHSLDSDNLKMNQSALKIRKLF